MIARWFASLYQALLRRAPAAQRDEYGAEMLAVATARIHEHRGFARMLRAVRELVDLWRVVRRDRRVADHARRRGTGGWATDALAALAALRHRRAAVAATTAILALGLAVGTVGFSLMSSVLLRPLPFGQPEQLVLIWGYLPRLQLGFPEVPLHGTRLLQLRESAKSVASIEGFKADVFNLDGPGGESERVDGLLTTAGLFDTMRVRPVVGRSFREGEDAPNAPCVAVVGFALWQRRFSGDPSVIGQPVRLNERQCTIVGVAPRGFEFPRGGEMPPSFQYPSRTELWVASPPPRTGPSDLTVLARLRDGVSVPASQADMDVLATQRDTQMPQSKGWNAVRVVPLKQQVVPPGTTVTVTALFFAVAVLLAVAVGNAAQLTAVRGLSRRMDIAVRAALGATAGRLARMAVLEALIVTGTAAAIAFGLTIAGVRLVRLLGPERFPRLQEVALGWPAIVFLIGAALLSAFLTALGPILLARHAGADDLLRGRARGASDQLRAVRTMMVGVQVALAVLLVTCSALLARSVVARGKVDPGFQPDHTLAFEITLPPNRYPEILRGAMPASRPEIIAAIDAFLVELRSISGVTSAAMGKPLPMSGASESSGFAADGVPPPRTAADVPVAEYIVVSDQFFQTLRTPIVSGREFTPADRETAERTVVVNQAMAHRLWPDGSAIGRHVKLGGLATSPAPWLTVVGVARDMKRYGLDDRPVAAMYVVYTQGGYPTLETVPFLVRSGAEDPMTLMPSIRAAALRAGLAVPIAAAQPLSALVARVSADATFAMVLMAGFALTALVLTVGGLYGGVAYAVSQRRRELGIRLALGAAPRQLIRLAILEATKPAAIGGAIGLALAVGIAQLWRSLLFGVSPADPFILAIVPAGLAIVTALACALPARRVSTIDPREALQAE